MATAVALMAAVPTATTALATAAPVAPPPLVPVLAPTAAAVMATAAVPVLAPTATPTEATKATARGDGGGGGGGGDGVAGGIPVVTEPLSKGDRSGGAPHAAVPEPGGGNPEQLMHGEGIAPVVEDNCATDAKAEGGVEVPPPEPAPAPAPAPVSASAQAPAPVAAPTPAATAPMPVPTIFSDWLKTYRLDGYIDIIEQYAEDIDDIAELKSDDIAIITRSMPVMKKRNFAELVEHARSTDPTGVSCS